MRAVDGSTENLFRVVVFIAVLAIAVIVRSPNIQAGPFSPFVGSCIPGGPASTTLTEDFARADAAVVVRKITDQRFASEAEPGSTTYQIHRILKGPQKLVESRQVVLERYRQAKPEDLFLLMGTVSENGNGLDWTEPLNVSEASIEYFTQAPSPKAVPAKRLPYFLKFLDVADPTVSNDAFHELARSDFKDIEHLTAQLPREKLRQWINDPKTPEIRLGVYGMMLGLCGDDADAQELEKRIFDTTKEFGLGRDGLMAGYLLIKKGEGLNVLDKHKLQNKELHLIETFNVIESLRFMWTYGSKRIPPERLQQSMRMLLDRPEMADLVITDLARWKDWSIQDKLMKMYGEGEYNTPSIKRAIVKYMLVSTIDSKIDAGAKIPDHVTRGRNLLEELHKKDPKTVLGAERFFMVP